MKTKDDILTAAAVFILFLTAMINWNFYSWLILAAIILLLLGWYARRE